MLIAVSGSQGTGKAQPNDCKVLTPTGWTQIGTCSVGDEILTPAGNRVQISGTFPHSDLQVYNITFSDGSQTRCCIDHLWKISTVLNEWIVCNTQDLINTYETTRVYIPSVEKLDFSIKHNESVCYYQYGRHLRESGSDVIEDVMLRSSYLDRLEILSGLIDCSVEIILRYRHEHIIPESASIDCIRQVTRSLGLNAQGDNGTISITPTNRYITNITPLEIPAECTCIMLDDEDHLYITDDYVVTHNTTVLTELEARGYNTIQRKTARSVLADWNMSLEQIYHDHLLHKQFQEDLIARKIEDEQIGIDSPDIWFTERTYADVFVYALFNLGNKNHNNEWINKYHNKCALFNRTYDYVFYLKPGLFEIEDDGVRGINNHYSSIVDYAMLQYTSNMTDSDKLTLITFADLDDRIKLIEDVIHNV